MAVGNHQLIEQVCEENMTRRYRYRLLRVPYYIFYTATTTDTKLDRSFRT